MTESISNNLWENVDAFSHFDSNRLTREEIIFIIKKILLSKFSGKKTEVHEYGNRINFACPYCGDSAKNPSKLRGNIYINNDNIQFHCYNCGKHSSFANFIKDFLDISDFNINDIKLRSTTFIKPTTKRINLNILNNEIINKYSIPKEVIIKSMHWVNVENTKAENYLNYRLIKNKKIFAYDNYYNSIIIFNTDNNNNVIGLQIRSLNKKSKQSRFFTYNLTKLYEKIYGNTEFALLENEKKIVSAIDSISTCFGILKVDFNKPITVFEGPFDALMFPNSIATSGASKNLPISIENIRYWYDNDPTGWKKSFQHLKKHESVFMWSKYWQDLGQKLNIKDLNELLIYSQKNKLNLLNFENYFSNNELDAIFI